MRSAITTRHLLWIGCALFALPLAAHAYAGTFSRYFGDDYCAGYIFHDHGLIGGQKWFYFNWGAVPTTLLLMAATERAGARLTPVLPAAAIVAWVAATAWAIRSITSRISIPWNRVTSLLVAEVVVFATIADAPNVVQSLYLRIPVFEYVGPLIALAWYAGFLAWASDDRQIADRGGLKSWATIMTSGAAAFVAGSLGPVYVVLQTTALGVAWLLTRMASPRVRARPLERLLVAGLAGSIGALAFVALAPGNAARQAHFPPSAGGVAIVKWSVFSTLFMFARPFLPLLRGTIVALVPPLVGSKPDWLPKALDMATSPLTLILAIGVPAWIAFTVRDVRPKPDATNAPGQVRLKPDTTGTVSTTSSDSGIRFTLAGAPIVAFVLVMACMAPSAYGTSAPPPPRALIIPGFVMMSLAACWGHAFGLRLRARRVQHDSAHARGVAFVALAVVAVSASTTATVATVHQGTRLRAWAARWDEVDQQLRLAGSRGERNAIVPALESVGGVGSIGPDPNDWVNSCAARYYGVDNITGVPRP